MKALQVYARNSFKKLEERFPAKNDWESMMPTWSSQGLHRGLLAWGETRTHDGDKVVIKAKKGCLPTVCRVPAVKALDLWSRIVGVPPVIAGESAKRAIKEGRFDGVVNFKQRGRTRGQTNQVRKEPIIPICPHTT